MGRYARHEKWVKRFLIILPVVIALVFLADLIVVQQFNLQMHASEGNADYENVYLSIDTREDSTSSWKKRDFSLNGETVDLNAQTFDGTVYNLSDHQLESWTFTLQIQSDCFLNNAWCGIVEIHQHAGTAEEKVQTLDLRNYNKDDITLDYLYDGDLLIPLEAGDYIVYYPSDKDNELSLSAHSELTIGFILYYLDKPDLSDYVMDYHYHRLFSACILFKIGVFFSIICVLILAGAIVMRITYRAAQKEMEMKKSGISAMSDIYSIIYIIDLNKNELIPVLAAKEAEQLRPKELSAQSQLRNLFEWDCSDAYRDSVLDFCNLDTLRERIRGRNTIVCEYYSKSHGWCQLRFFVMERNEQKELQQVIFAIQEINEEKEELEALHAVIQEKTDDIISIQQKIVIGMANIIENRDNNTGGHVKRTSEVIHILVDEAQKLGVLPVDDTLAVDIVRAAPMHDLGKITIDSSILCKPARLTKEEYEIMKTHSTKSGEMVMLLLDGVEEEHFVKTAFQIARHHHERWDGKGYPDGLKGDEIPVEARIMAIADVYDALVSKRCYKEPMSFEEAYKIMLEGMGSQFDPHMKDVFIACHEKLEAYYKNA